MKGSRPYSGMVAVAILVLLTAVAGGRFAVVTGVVAELSKGLFVATAAFALFDYKERRDPALLLVGIGCGALAVHSALIVLSIAAFAPKPGGRFAGLAYFSSLAELLVLTGSLLAIVAFRERRGRPPLEPARTAAGVVGGLIVLDVLAWLLKAGAVTVITGAQSKLGILGLLGAVMLLFGGLALTVLSITRGGRFGWLAGAGLSLGVYGFALVLSRLVSTEHSLAALGRLASITPALTAACLAIFVLAGLRLESSRMRRASDRAQEVMDGRAEIASMVAHDVKGPVGTIKGLATTTRKSYERLGDAERLEFVGLMEQEASHLLALVNQIALALKVDAGTLEYDLREQEVAPLVRLGAEQAGVDEDRLMVEAPDGIRARVDAQWLPEAVRQAVDNAAKFSPPGTPVRVSVSAPSDDKIVIEIRDEGPGIPAAQSEAVFLKFARWRPTGYEDRPGSGLGLFICRGIAREHGGEASVVATAGGGTILRIQLPREGTA